MIKYIDLEKNIRNADSKILKKMPRFAIHILARIIKQNEMNVILNKYDKDLGVDFLPKMIEEYNLTLQIENPENLPGTGKCIFVANHPFGIIDGLVLTHIVARKYGTLKAIGNDAFMLIPNLRPLIAAVNVYGKNPKDYIQALDEVYKSDTPITHFPAGAVSRIYGGRVQDCEWQKSFITKAIQTNRCIVPIYFYGRNSRWFYTLYLLRRAFGIKTNLELMLLPGEMLKKINKTIRVKIGKPIVPEQFHKSQTHQQWAQKVRDHVFTLGKTNDSIHF